MIITNAFRIERASFKVLPVLMTGLWGEFVLPGEKHEQNHTENLPGRVGSRFLVFHGAKRVRS